MQARRLAAAGPVFHERLATLPPGPLLLIANEWLDALPIRQFLRRGGTWRERVVQAGRPAEAVPEPPLPPLPAKAPEGAVVEVSEAARTAVSALAGRLAAAPGVALFLDYGPAESGFGDTLQALRAGRPVDPFGAEPADITAHVDFAALAAAARTAGATVHGPLPQGVFLQRIGLAARAAVLAAAEGARGARHLAAAHAAAGAGGHGPAVQGVLPHLPWPAGAAGLRGGATLGAALGLRLPTRLGPARRPAATCRGRCGAGCRSPCPRPPIRPMWQPWTPSS